MDGYVGVYFVLIGASLAAHSTADTARGKMNGWGHAAALLAAAAMMTYGLNRLGVL